jgi:hypothetical protein
VVSKNIISFLTLAHMLISTYFRPNIHQNGPEILGVNQFFFVNFYHSTVHGGKERHSS